MLELMIVYCFNSVIFGAIYDSYGPLLPYLSEVTGLTESSFTIIFTMRGVGYIIGGVLKLKLMSEIDLHRGLAISCFFGGLSSILLLINLSQFWLGMLSFFLFTCTCLVDIFMHIAILRCGKNKEALFMGIGFTFESVGNGIGPFMVWIF
jgi:predicted MFS family arabinose efflux permease